MIYTFTQEEKDQFIRDVLASSLSKDKHPIQDRLDAIRSYLEENIEVKDSSYQKRMENIANTVGCKSTSPEFPQPGKLPDRGKLPNMEKLLRNSFSGKDNINQYPLMPSSRQYYDENHIQRIFARIDLLEEGIPNAPSSYFDSPGDDRPHGMDYVIHDPNPYGDSTKICIDLTPVSFPGEKMIRVNVEVTEGFLKQTYNTYLTTGSPVYTFLQNYMPDDLADLEDTLK
nr:MAG TPA: hypothetical protein [Caudoviricetes sp.]